MRYYAIPKSPLPRKLYGSESEVAIRELTEDERFSIEDFFFKHDRKVSITAGTTAIVIDHSQLAKPIISEEIAVFVEFGLALLTVSGFEPISLMASLSQAGECTDAFFRPTVESQIDAVFPAKMKEGASNIWFRQLLMVRKKSKDRLHITADRFVRYSRIQETPDALLDLCICLESLLDAETEISFRFGICLAKITRFDEAEELSYLLSDLYSLRSKLVHGADASKPHKKVNPHLVRLRLAARTILTNYIIYLTSHTKEEWKTYLRSSLFA